MSSKKYSYIVIIISTLTICSIFWFMIPESYKVIESSDYLSYYKPAGQNILSNKPIEGIEPNKIGYKYVPGFPIALSFLFKISLETGINENTIIFYFSVICLAISALILYEISIIFWNNNESLLISFIYLTYPLILWFIKQPNPESLFTPLLFMSILLFIKAKEHNKHKELYLMSGIFLGCSILTRPIAIGIPIIYSLFYLYQNNAIQKISKKTLISLILMNLGISSLIIPWEYYIYTKEKKIIVLSTNGSAGVYDGLTFNVNLKNYRVKKNLPDDIEFLMIQINNQISIKSELNIILKVLVNELKNNPLSVIKLYIYKSIRSLYATDSQRNEREIFIIQIFYLLLILYSIVLVIKNKHFKEYSLFFIVLFFYFWFMATTSLSIVRYMTPIIGFMFIFIPALIKFRKKKNIIKINLN